MGGQALHRLGHGADRRGHARDNHPAGNHAQQDGQAQRGHDHDARGGIGGGRRRGFVVARLDLIGLVVGQIRHEVVVEGVAHVAGIEGGRLGGLAGIRQLLEMVVHRDIVLPAGVEFVRDAALIAGIDGGGIDVPARFHLVDGGAHGGFFLGAAFRGGGDQHRALQLAIAHGVVGEGGKALRRDKIVAGQRHGAVIDGAQAVDREDAQQGGDCKHGCEGRHDLAADRQILEPVHIRLPLAVWLGRGIGAPLDGGFSGANPNVSEYVGSRLESGG